jgi:hypothetical protein
MCYRKAVGADMCKRNSLNIRTHLFFENSFVNYLLVLYICKVKRLEQQCAVERNSAVTHS